MAFGAKSRKAERGEVELLRSLVKLANQLQSSLELGAIVHVIATALNDTFGFREASVYLAEPDWQTFRVRATVGENPEYDRELFRRPVPKRIWDELFLEKHRIGSSFFVDHHRHLWTQEQLHYLPPLDLGPRAADEWHQDDSLLVPLLDKQRRLMGVLDLYDPADRRQPTLELVTSLEVFATHAAVAIENARQYEQLEATKAQLEAQLTLRQQLNQLSTALLSTLDQTDVFRQITTMLKGIVDYDAMDIRLVDEDTRELVCIYSREANAEQVQRFRISVDEGVSGWVVRHNEAQLVNDMLHDPRIVQVPGTGEDEPQASIMVPLDVRGRVTGVLCLDRLAGRTFEAHELEPVQLFGNLAAIAIDNARSYEEMERQAISDGLTGIHNYRHFHETLQAEVSRAERYGETFCLLMMDLDHFKAVNDTIGHQKGDDVLRAVSTVLRGCSRESDYLARYGGEEFVILLPNTGLEEARTLAERVRASVAALDPGHPDLHVTMSIGVAAFPESADDSDGVLGAADAALLRAKAQGRNRVCLFSDGQTDVAAGLEGELVALGRRFAAFLDLSAAEAAGLITALAVHETGGTVQEEVQAILGSGRNGDAEPNDVQRSAVDALVYGNERWDGSGYPEGRSGNAIPRVARAFAVCRRWESATHNGASVDGLRGLAAKELDPRMVQRFTAMLRAETAAHN
jgi:diguanylate cyclase (GGDEF)-like protein